MRKLVIWVIFPLFLAACAGWTQPPVAPGQSLAEVRQRLGQPTNTYQDGADTLLEYAHGPWGRTTWMARFGPDGRLRSYEQVLTAQKFATVKLHRDTKATILHTFGRPMMVTHYYSVDGDVWLYRYKEQDVWNSTMAVEFDRQGVVQAMVNGPDEEMEMKRR